jgi:hypothetical protein
MTKPSVTLIFGEPGNGKSWLAERLSSNILHVDKIYIGFIKDKYPRLYLESLNLVVSQHYSMVLGATEKNHDREWAKYLMGVIQEHLGGSLVVEGYLIEPVLKSLRYRLSKVARVSVVYVKDRRYYHEWTPKLDSMSS